MRLCKHNWTEIIQKDFIILSSQLALNHTICIFAPTWFAQNIISEVFVR